MLFQVPFLFPDPCLAFSFLPGVIFFSESSMRHRRRNVSFTRCGGPPYITLQVPCIILPPPRYLVSDFSLSSRKIYVIFLRRKYCKWKISDFCDRSTYGILKIKILKYKLTYRMSFSTQMRRYQNYYSWSG